MFDDAKLLHPALVGVVLQQEEADCVSAPMLSALFPDAAIDAAATTGRRTAVAALAMHVAGDAIVFISSICKESICCSSRRIRMSGFQK